MTDHRPTPEAHDERVRTPVGAHDRPERAASAGHGTPVHEGGHTDDHMDVHMAAEHAAEAPMLGPIDVAAWGAALVGIGVGVLVAYLFYLATI